MRALLLCFQAITVSSFINAFIPSKMTPWISHNSKILRDVVLCSKDSDPSKDAAGVNNPLMPATRQQTVKDFHPSRQSDVDRWRIQFPLCHIPNDAPLLLPEIREEDRGKKCLVLDLDDTLIYGDSEADTVDLYYDKEVCTTARLPVSNR
jgi:hypothetical protein